MIPFTNDTSGLRDYRAHAVRELAAPRWPWVVLIAFLAGLFLGVLR